MRNELEEGKLRHGGKEERLMGWMTVYSYNNIFDNRNKLVCPHAP